MRRWALILSIFCLLASSARAQFEAVGKVVTLPEQPGAHWFWLSDILLHRTALFDADTGGQLGAITSGSAGVGFVIAPLFSPDHREIYLAETYYSRGVRGDRTDVVTVYDARTFAPLAEVGIPPRRGEYFPGNAANALTDDGRFMAVLNVTPATSISIVDVKARRFTSEVPTPGCSLVFAAGPRRFFSLCANGAALVLVLDDQGNQKSLERTEPFFDAQKDPVTEKAVRRGNEWLFVSFEGIVHPVDVSGGRLAFGETWPLLTDEDQSAHWRIGGSQHLAVHAGLKRLYVLMHRGERDTHKDSGTEVWVYDLAGKKRVQRIPVLNPLASFVSVTGGFDRRRGGSFAKWLMTAAFPNPGVERILVTQDEHPILVASASLPPTITIHDAMTGRVIREISEPGLAGSLLFTP
jgi:methylamine dehydrogenase heavy chain